jgi:type IV pilus assembly protein PilX
MMNGRTTARQALGRAKQRGVVLFFALIALVVMSLAAVALIRSVDTSTMIAGNLAFRQSATTSADAGAEAAMAWLSTQQTAMTARWNPPADYRNVLNDTTNTFNINSPANGYYTAYRATNSDFTDGTFDWAGSVALPVDASGNTVRYVIERMCRLNLNTVLPLVTDCMFTQSSLNNQPIWVKRPSQVCDGPGCPNKDQSLQFRITARVTGPKNTVSYIQTFVY